MNKPTRTRLVTAERRLRAVLRGRYTVILANARPNEPSHWLEVHTNVYLGRLPVATVYAFCDVCAEVAQCLRCPLVWIWSYRWIERQKRWHAYEHVILYL